MISIFDPSGEYFSHRLYREHCTKVDGFYLKDLSRLGRPLNQTILVDNSIKAFALQMSNGVPIASFFGQQWDCELQFLVSASFAFYS